MRWKVLDRVMNVSEVPAPGSLQATLPSELLCYANWPRSSWEGLSLKPRAQLTFSSWNKVKALGKLDATNLAQVHHSIVRARGEPLERSVVPSAL